MRSLSIGYAGGGAGSAAALGLLAYAQPAAPVAWALAAVGALFLVYFVRTVGRQLTHFELDEAGIRARGPLVAAIRWEDLRSLQLDYYSTRRDREEGWMQLKLSDAQSTIRIDSELDGFGVVAGRAAQAAAQRGLALDAATLSNLEALAGGNGGTSVPPFRGRAGG